MIPQKWLGELYGLHRNYIGAVERAEWTPSIVAADRLARALGRTLSEMLAEVEREEGRLRRLEETLSGDRGPTPVARISNAPWSGRCLPVKRGAGFRRGAFVGWFHGTSPNPLSGPIARARIIHPREHQRDGHPQPAFTRLLHTRSSRSFSGSVDRRGCYRESTVFG